MSAGHFLTEDVKNLMQRLSRTLQDVNGKSAENSDNSTMTFEPDHDEVRTFSTGRRMHRKRSSSPCIPEESLQQSPSHSSKQIRRTVSSERFKSVTLRRMQERARRTQQNREQFEKQREDKLKEDTQHFRMSDRSKEMAGKMDPLPVRTAKILEEREKKKQEVLQKREQAKEDSLKPELTFKPKINGMKREKMTPEDFYAYNVKWMEESKKTLTAKEEVRMISVNKAVTLKPALDAHSRKLAKQSKYASRPETRMTEFLKNRQKKVEDMRKTLEPSFTPEICSTSKKMVKKLMGKPLTDRLYTPPALHWKDVLASAIEPTPDTQGSSPSTPRLSFGKID